jgi:PAS domain S-box-containing protein
MTNAGTQNTLWNESDRLEALRRYQILDTPAEEEFDNIAKLISQICDMPVSLISLVDENRQWFKSETGLGLSEMPLELSVCKTTIQQGGLFVVPDLSQDNRFENNPIVKDNPNFRFYAGATLETKDGFPLGALCVLDYKPRVLTVEQTFALQTLSKVVMTQLELRRALIEKRESEQHFRDMANSINQMIWVTRPDGYHEYYNKRWYEYTGIPEHSSDGDGWKNLFHPEDQERAAKRWQHSLDTGESYEMEYRLRRADGEYRWALGRAECVKNTKGVITKWYGTCTDIQELVDEREKSKDASIAKSEFLASMSHEIRTPINAIIGLANILAHSSPLTPKQYEFIQTLQMSADTLVALVNDLLDISKIEARSVELENIPFSLTQIVQEIISMMTVRAKEKNLSFNITIADPHIENSTYTGDPNRLRQILINLCSNALKFTEQGSIDITLSAKPGTADATEQVTIIVKDTGIGIAEDKLDTIFTKFKQADISISRKYGGTGLGLAISKTLAEIMGGTITVESVIDQGSTFTVVLPFGSENKNPAIPTAPDPVETIPALEAKEKILLVEDYPANVLVTSTFLEKFGYECEVASNGIEAINMVRGNNYALVLMDVQMQGMNGLEATVLIREYEKQKNLGHIPIIGMTAHAMSGDKERCLAAGMDDYLPKPFNSEELHSKIKNLIN